MTDPKSVDSLVSDLTWALFIQVVVRKFFYKNIEVEIGEILKLRWEYTQGWDEI